MKNRAFSEYFIDCTTRESLKDPEKIVTTIDADLKTVHFTAETRKKIYQINEHLKSEKRQRIILSGWKVAVTTKSY